MKIHGKVVTGLGIGAKLGYPTANLECDNAEFPASGVYAAQAMVDGAAYNAALIIGARENNRRPLIEVFFFDFKGDLYGKTLTVEVSKKVSDIEQCEDELALKHKIEDDLRKVRLCLQG